LLLLGGRSLDLVFCWGLRIRSEHGACFGLVVSFCRSFGRFVRCLELTDWILAFLVLFLFLIILRYFLTVVDVVFLVVLRSSLVVLLVLLIVIRLFLTDCLVFVPDLRLCILVHEVDFLTRHFRFLSKLKFASFLYIFLLVF
jgi:hypothetical protein